MTKTIFPWLEEYSVHVALIDEQHKRFVKLMNDIFEATTKPDFSDEILMKLVTKLAEHGKTHFATEEKYFKLFNYEFAEEHIAQHKKILAHIGTFMAEDHEPYKEAGAKLLMFLEEWLVDHLAYWDKKYTKCFNEHGLV